MRFDLQTSLRALSSNWKCVLETSNPLYFFNLSTIYTKTFVTHVCLSNFGLFVCFAELVYIIVLKAFWIQFRMEMRNVSKRQQHSGLGVVFCVAFVTHFPFRFSILETFMMFKVSYLNSILSVYLKVLIEGFIRVQQYFKIDQQGFTFSLHYTLHPSTFI